MSSRITCPSGATAVIRKLNVRDVQSLGMIPDVLGDESDKPVKSDASMNLEVASKLTTIALTKCLLGYTTADGKRQSVYDTEPLEIENEKTIAQSIAMQNPQILSRLKDLTTLPDGVIRLSEFLTHPDSSFIVSEVMALSGIGVAAKEAVRPFPAEPKQPAPDLLAGESVPSSPK